ncbi:unnamed protein product [Taenia asiatica]|uniref:tRNA (N(6)-L-threonylcarbamoyladenosine(37)-C(2))-methylthiotransferase n=1 Tax=Taenia asiatica TaxID=60517 RepID=A0A158R741_TAEAS|nr:unnamed protein product [Taenia asiatica]
MDIEDICIEPLVINTSNKVHRSFIRRKRSEDAVDVFGDNIPGTQRIFVQVWGCAHNTSDAEYMAGLLAAYGYKVTLGGSCCSNNASGSDDDEAAKAAADLWLLNSCTVKGPAEDHFRNAIFAAKAAGKRVVVAGCVPQGSPNVVYLKDVSVVGVQQIDRVVEVVEQTLLGRFGLFTASLNKKTLIPPSRRIIKPHGYVLFCIDLSGNVVRFMEKRMTPVDAVETSRQKRLRPGAVPLSLPKIRRNPFIEILAISTGCLNACTYCKTKHARGVLASYTVDELVQRAVEVFNGEPASPLHDGNIDQLVLIEGVKELWLTSEDLGAYGRDLSRSEHPLATTPPQVASRWPHHLTLVDLLFALVPVIPAGCMLRLGMTNPPYILDQLPEVATVLRHPRVYAFLHIPVQSGSNAVLNSMRREYTVEEFRKVVDFLEKEVHSVDGDKMTVATDVICGFPTETEPDFQATFQLIEHYKFPVLFINQFFARPGTPAETMMRKATTAAVKKRTRKLHDLFRTYRPFADRVGRRYRVLITETSTDGKYWVGHTKAYEQILLPKEPELQGHIVLVEVTECDKFYMRGAIVDQGPFLSLSVGSEGSEHLHLCLPPSFSSRYDIPSVLSSSYSICMSKTRLRLLSSNLVSLIYEVDISDNITSFSISNYPSLLSRNETHIWEFRTANRGPIVIRKHYVLLFPGDELIIFDDFADSRAELARYSMWNSSKSKVVSSGDSVALELTNSANLSVTMLGDASHIFAFNFTLEAAGFCSLNNTDRVSCESSQEQRCYSMTEDRCDGFWDCPFNGRDEAGCLCPSAAEFACADFSVSASCYSLAQRCDGVYHCTDKSDEASDVMVAIVMYCLESQCSLEALRFLCVPLNSSARLTGACIPLERICDDHLDCANGADEASHLCRSSAPANSSSAIASIAQLFAAQVAHEAVKEAAAAALSRVDSRLRTLLTYVLSALFGPLLIVLTVGLMCRSSAASVAAGRRSAEEARRARQQARFNSPIQRLIRDEIRRRPPPPTYEEALNNSLFEEPILEGVVPPPPPEPLPGALSQDRIAAVRELSMKPAPTRVDVAISCNLLGDVITPVSAHNHHYRRRRRQPLLTSSSSHAQPISALLATPTATEEGEIEGMPQSFIEGSSGQGLLGRWFMSTLGSWRRAGSGVGDDVVGSRRDYEQPEVSEATVVSSMQEEVEDEYASITSRRESVDGGDEEEVDEGVAGGAPMEEEMLEATTAAAERELEDVVVETSRAGGDDDDDHFPSLRTILLAGTHSNGASVGNI